VSEGQGSISYSSQGGGAVPPFVNVEGARNGDSLDADNFVVLGQDEGAGAAGPAELLNNREIPLGAFLIQFLRTGANVMQLGPNGFTLFQLFPNAVALTDLGLKVGTVPASSLAASSFLGVFDNSNNDSLAMQIIPTSFGIGDGVMLASGQGSAPTNYFLFFYEQGGVGLGGSDFANNNGNLGGLSVDGPLLGQKLPVIKTGPYTLDNRFDSGKVFTNTGAGALVVFQLPDAETLDTFGFFDFYVDSPNGIQIVAGGADVIRIGPNQSAAAGSATGTTQGNALRLLLLDPGQSSCQWVAQSVIGPWVVV
jgi:hypothetical protein